jgi:hypothetical protein
VGGNAAVSKSSVLSSACPKDVPEIAKNKMSPLENLNLVIFI